MAKEGKKKDKGTAGPKSDLYNLGGPGKPVADEDRPRFTIKEHLDDLLLITPREMKEATTDYGTSDVMEADVVVLNAGEPAKSVEYEAAWIFATVVISQLKGPLEKRSRVVGTLIEDVASKKPGKSAPYRLTAPSDADIEVAKQYLDSVSPF